MENPTTENEPVAGVGPEWPAETDLTRASRTKGAGFMRLQKLSRMLAVAGFLTVGLSTNAAAQDTEEQGTNAETERPSLLEYLATTNRLTGDWGGVRTELEEKGFALQLLYHQHYAINLRGGLETQNGNDFGGTMDLNIVLDFEKMGLIPGGSFFIRGKSRYGGDVSDFDREKIGGIFRTNGDVGSEQSIYVDKWHYRQRFLDDRIQINLGRLDMGDYVEKNAYAQSADVQFLNSALADNPTVPTRNGIGAVLTVWPTDWLYGVVGAVDADSQPRTWGFDEAFHNRAVFRGYAELGVLTKIASANGDLPGTYRFGTWYVPDERPIYFNDLGGLLAPRERGDDVGFYLSFDQMLLKENNVAGDKQGLGMFARYGYAHGDVNFLEHFWSLGMQYQGLIPNRDKDVLGFGVAQGIVSGDLRALDPSFDRETVYETYYAIKVAPWITVTPDLQVITQPGGQQDDRNAVVAAFRVRMSF
jgi:porin